MCWIKITEKLPIYYTVVTVIMNDGSVKKVWRANDDKEYDTFTEWLTDNVFYIDDIDCWWSDNPIF